jgi:hypothetical protein
VVYSFDAVPSEISRAKGKIFPSDSMRKSNGASKAQAPAPGRLALFAALEQNGSAWPKRCVVGAMASCSDVAVVPGVPSSAPRAEGELSTAEE